MAQSKPLHPLAREALMVGLRMAARATAKAFDSLLKDTASGLGAAERKVQRTRQKIKKKVQASFTPPPIEDDEEETGIIDAEFEDDEEE
jgi:hypothetical protein